MESKNLRDARSHQGSAERSARGIRRLVEWSPSGAVRASSAATEELTKATAALIAEVSELRREVTELRAEVERLKSQGFE